jgi:hypothetical protein
VYLWTVVVWISEFELSRRLLLFYVVLSLNNMNFQTNSALEMTIRKCRMEIDHEACFVCHAMSIDEYLES